jgi:hypothetical protein
MDDIVQPQSDISIQGSVNREMEEKFENSEMHKLVDVKHVAVHRAISPGC